MGEGHKWVVDLINEAIPDTDDFFIGDVAPIIQQALEENPDMRALWHAEMEENWIHDALRRVMAGRRSRVRRRFNAEVFGSKVRQFASGEVDASIFDVHYTVDEEGRKRRFADMTASDHLFVAKSYDVTARKAAFLSTFHREIAKRVGTGNKTSDVLSADQAESIYRNLLGAMGVTDDEATA